jgi:hypothetical protein
MPEYDNTDNPTEHALDYDSWEIAFLFHNSQFHHVAYEMFRKVAGGKLTFEEEEKLRALGLEF